MTNSEEWSWTTVFYAAKFSSREGEFGELSKRVTSASGRSGKYSDGQGLHWWLNVQAD